MERGTKWDRTSFVACAIVVIMMITGILITISGGEDKKNSSVQETSSVRQIAKRELEKPEIIEDFLTKNPYSRPATKLKNIKGIVVHYTANPGATAKNNRNYFENLSKTKETYASSHFIVDMDGSIIQCIPLDEIAYCSNNRNEDTIAIEVCHMDDTGEFTTQSYNATVCLCAWLCSKYQLEAREVIRHYDITGKNCPKFYVENPEEWEQFVGFIHKRLMEG